MQGLERWGGEVKGWWTHSPHLQPQQGTAAACPEEMGQSCPF